MYRLFLLLAGWCLCLVASAQDYHIRINQTGYLPSETKQAIVFSHSAKTPVLQLIAQQTGAVISELASETVEADGWGTFPYYWQAAISATDGRCSGPCRIPLS